MNHDLPSSTEQSNICHTPPTDKRKYLRDIGQNLVRDYGKKKYYKPDQVNKAHTTSAWSGLDFSCWAMCTYSSHEDFDAYHEQTGEVCNYTEMKSTMLEGVSVSDDVHLADIADVDLDVSWLDAGALLDGVLEGIGDFFAAIADGVS